MMRTNATMMPAISRRWTNPPKVYDSISAENHSPTRTDANVSIRKCNRTIRNDIKFDLRIVKRTERESFVRIKFDTKSDVRTRWRRVRGGLCSATARNGAIFQQKNRDPRGYVASEFDKTPKRPHSGASRLRASENYLAVVAFRILLARIVAALTISLIVSFHIGDRVSLLLNRLS